MDDLRHIETHEVVKSSGFGQRDLTRFVHKEAAYHQLLMDIMVQQVASTRLVLTENGPVNHLFVDGGFSRNSIYMHLLAEQFPEMSVFAASVAQATAVGAALSIHEHWNAQPIPSDLIALKFYGL